MQKAATYSRDQRTLMVRSAFKQFWYDSFCQRKWRVYASYTETKSLCRQRTIQPMIPIGLLATGSFSNKIHAFGRCGSHSLSRQVAIGSTVSPYWVWSCSLRAAVSEQAWF